jgi:DNA-binding IclR family transcriptional regulator
MPRPSPQTERVAAIFDLLVQTNRVGYTLSDISKRLGVNRASCLHTLAALASTGYLIRDPADKRYYLGPAMAVAGRVAEEQFPALIEARPVMARLTAELGLSIIAFAPAGIYTRVVHYTWGESQRPPVRIGQLLYLRPPLGSLPAAFSGDAGIATWLAQRDTITGTEAVAYREKLAAIRRNGWMAERPLPRQLFGAMQLVYADPKAVNEPIEPDRYMDDSMRSHDLVITDVFDDESYDIASVNAGIFDHHGVVVLVLSLRVESLIDGANLKRLGDLLRSNADSVSEAIKGKVPDN